MSSDTIEIELDSENLNILNVKEKISIIKNISVESIRLIFAGRILEDSKSLENYKIKDNLTIICLIKKKVNLPQQDTSTSVPIMPPLMQTSMPPTSSAPTSTTTSIPSQTSFGPANYQNIQTVSNMLQNPQISQVMSGIMQNPQMRDYMLNSTLQNMNIPHDSPMRGFYENMLVNIFSDPQQCINLMNSIYPNQMQNSPNNSIPEQTLGVENITNMMNTFNFNQFQNINNEDVINNEDIINNEDELSTSNNLQEVNINELREKYSEQIEQIKNMGFEDENKIIEILSESSGSISIAINKLL